MLPKSHCIGKDENMSPVSLLSLKGGLERSFITVSSFVHKSLEAEVLKRSSSGEAKTWNGLKR